MYTILHTPDNQQITIPNGSLANNVVKNYSSHDTRRVVYRIGISYDADIKLTKTLIEKVVSSSEFPLGDKDVVVAVDELSESAVVILVRFRVPSSVYFDAFHELLEAIKLELDKHDVVLAHPQVVIRSTSE